jgi:hypothetical protein
MYGWIQVTAEESEMLQNKDLVTINKRGKRTTVGMESTWWNIMLTPAVPLKKH